MLTPYYRFISSSKPKTQELESPQIRLDMESDQDVERIQLAIQKLMEEKQRQKDGSIRTLDDEKQLLAKLLSQVGGSKEPRVSKERNRSTREGDKGVQEGMIAAAVEEISKELKAVKKQNRITHWLLSALIVVTLGWQLSEVSIILKLKDGVSHPFRSFAQMLVGNFNGSPPNGNGGAADKQNSNNKQQHSQPLIEIPFTSHSADSS